MSQTLWGNIDQANNAPLFAPAQVGTQPGTGSPTEVNRAALYGNTTANAFTVTTAHANGVITGTYGVSVAEMDSSAVGQVTSVVVTSAGSGFTARPTVVFAGGGASVNAAATATAKVVTVSLGGGVSGGINYGAGDVVTINATGAAGASATSNANVLTVNASGSVLTLSINTAGSFTTLPTTVANNAVTGGNGTGLLVNLLFGVNTVTLTGNGAGYTGVPAITFGGGGVGASATAGLQSEESKVPAAGWNLRTVKPNGRVQWETLVAMKSLTGDGSDSAILPQ